MNPNNDHPPCTPQTSFSYPNQTQKTLATPYDVRKTIGKPIICSTLTVFPNCSHKIERNSRRAVKVRSSFSVRLMELCEIVLDQAWSVT